MVILRALLVLLIVVSVLVFVLLLSGVYDVGADTPHWSWVERLAAGTRNASIDKRAKDIAAPNLDESALVAQGAQHYSEMCAGCHGAPGAEESELRKGLYPKPPDLRTSARGDPSRQFWVIKHGIKLSAMPAWGATHDDAAIWSIVAFLQKLPALSAAQYQTLTGTEEGGEPHHRHEGQSAEDEGHSTVPAKRGAH